MCSIAAYSGRMRLLAIPLANPANMSIIAYLIHIWSEKLSLSREKAIHEYNNSNQDHVCAGNSQPADRLIDIFLLPLSAGLPHWQEADEI